MAAEPPAAPLSRVARVVATVESGLLVLTLAAVLALAVTQIALRNLLDTGLVWADPLVRVLVLWVGMIGAVAASRDDRQITVDVLSRFMNERTKRWARLVTDLFTALVAGVLAWHSGRLILEERAGGAVAFAQVPVWVCELVLPLAFGLIAARYLALFAARLRPGS